MSNSGFDTKYQNLKKIRYVFLQPYGIKNSLIIRAGFLVRLTLCANHTTRSTLLLPGFCVATRTIRYGGSALSVLGWLLFFEGRMAQWFKHQDSWS